MKTHTNKTIIQNKKEKFLRNVFKSINDPSLKNTQPNYFKDTLQSQFTWNRIVKDVILSNRKFSIKHFAQNQLPSPQINQKQIQQESNKKQLKPQSNKNKNKNQSHKHKLKTIIYIPFKKPFKSQENSIQANTFQINNQYLCVKKQKLKQSQLQNMMDKLRQENHQQKIHEIDLSNEINENLKKIKMITSQNSIDAKNKKFETFGSVDLQRKSHKLPIRKMSRRNFILENNSNKNIRKEIHESIDQIRDSLNKIIKSRYLYKKKSEIP